jgi:hypothetical protein
MRSLRSFSGVDFLTVALAALALCALANPYAVYHFGQWLYGESSSLIRHAEDFVRGTA